MPAIVVVTPTLSAAVASVGGTLARHAGDGHTVTVIEVFGGAGGPDDASVADATTTLGIGGVVTVGLGDPGDAADDAVRTALAVACARLEPDLALAPLGLDGDARARAIATALDALGLPRLRWVDLPYAVTRTAGAPLGHGELIAIPIADQLDRKLAACTALGIDTDPELLAAHARDEGARLGVGGPVELLLGPPDA